MEIVSAAFDMDTACVNVLMDNGVFVERLSRMEEKQKFLADSVTGEAELDGEKPEDEQPIYEAAPENPQGETEEENHEH